MKGGVTMDRSWMEKARIEQGLTQTQVAVAADCAISTYSRIEKGLLNPDVRTALRICDCLKINVRQFLREKPII